MEKIISDFKNTSDTVPDSSADNVRASNIEFEVRFKEVSKEDFLKILNNLTLSGSGASIEQTLTTIVADKFRRMQKFTNGKKVSDQFMKKTNIGKPLYQEASIIPYSININREEIVDEQKADLNSIVRFKNRLSVPLKNWRVDFTIVKNGSLRIVGPNLPNLVKEYLVADLNSNNYVDYVNKLRSDKYEIEIEYIGKKEELDIVDLNNVINKVLEPLRKSSPWLDSLLYVANLIIPKTVNRFSENPSLKNLLNQARSITKIEYLRQIYPPIGYYVTDKADGERSLVFSRNGDIMLLTETDLVKLEGKCDNVIVADAEFIKNQQPYLFDLLIFNGESLLDKGFNDRVARLADAAKLLNCNAKSYTKITTDNISEAFKTTFNSKKSYETDGLIITSEADAYFDTKNYKWKPSDKNTIDFIVYRVPNKYYGIKPYIKSGDHNWYILCVSISYEQQQNYGLSVAPELTDVKEAHTGGKVFPIQFSPSINPTVYQYQSSEDLHGKIVEMAWIDNAWKMVGVRLDRTGKKDFFGNNFAVAESTFQNSLLGFNLEDLWKPSVGYFGKIRDDIYIAPNRYKRAVIDYIINEFYADNKWLVDLAGGRGADLGRYQSVGVQNALFIDIDLAALTELIFRKLQPKNAQKAGPAGKPRLQHRDIVREKSNPKNTTVYVMQADLKTAANTIVDKIVEKFKFNPGMADGAVCNFALHYFCDTIDNLKNVLRLASMLLKHGGVFSFIVMDGEKVVKLLTDVETNDEWKVSQGPRVKYAIKKLYTGNKLQPFGQKIAIKLPMSDEYYEEPLCNINKVDVELRRSGFEILISKNFTEYTKEFAKGFPALDKELTTDDRTYIDLHHVVVAKKIKDVKFDK